MARCRELAVLAIPFNRTFSVEEQDKTLQSKLMEELPGILNWAIQGCLEWQREGLNPPKIVQDQVAGHCQNKPPCPIAW